MAQENYSAGQPRVGTNMTSLGVRVRDLHPRVDGTVDPQGGGVSVSPRGEENLPRSARTVLDNDRGLVFELETDELPGSLSYRSDPYNESHAFIEPAYPMKFEAYQRAIGETSSLWRPA